MDVLHHTSHLLYGLEYLDHAQVHPSRLAIHHVPERVSAMASHKQSKRPKADPQDPGQARHLRQDAVVCCFLHSILYKAMIEHLLDADWRIVVQMNRYHFPIGAPAELLLAVLK